jgi:hypothetical protein
MGGRKLEGAEPRRAARWMRYGIHGMSVVLIALGLIVVVQELSENEVSEDAAASEIEPASLEALEGSSLVRVTLTPRAAERVDVQAVLVREGGAGSGTKQKIVPYGSVIYDATGETWVYTSPEPLVFVRAPVKVDRVEGRNAYLSDGPATGTEVVSVGAAELYGAEFEVGH